MKFSFAYVKQNPVMFGVIVVVFGLGLWLVLNRGSGGSSGGVAVVNSKSDQQAALEAQVAMAGMQLQGQQVNAQAQLAALAQQGQTEIALANLSAQLGLAQLSVEERINEKVLGASTVALEMQLDNALQLTQANNSFALDYARTAADAAVDQVRLGAQLQAQLSSDQLKALQVTTAAQKEAFETQAVLSVIPTLKKKNRDDVLKLIAPKVLA